MPDLIRHPGIQEAEPLRGGLRVKPAMTMEGDATTPAKAGDAMTNYSPDRNVRGNSAACVRSRTL
jgi:hypothetical protein